MARRLIKRNNSSHTFRESSRRGSIGIVICQHVLLWSALYVAASTSYLIATRVITLSILPPSIVLLVACATSLAYVVSHNAATYHHSRPFGDTSKRCNVAKAVAKGSLRAALTLWMGGCGTNIMFTAAREPFCLMSESNGIVAAIDTGTACFVQRASVAASLLALISGVALFILTITVAEPYRCHLFGITEDPQPLPMLLPYNNKKEKVMYSEMSFKCRSSTSLSTATLVPSQEHEKEDYGMYPTQPEKAYGLGITTPKRATASFLAPRPSLTSIRQHTQNGPAQPPSSPLPPLPAYFPGRHYRSSPSQRATLQPQRSTLSPPIPPKSRSRSLVTPRPGPGLAPPSLRPCTKSAESLSSVYSRSTSGEKGPPLRRPAFLAPSSRSSSSSSTATLRRSPLGVMRRASDPDTILLPDQESRTSLESLDIDDAATLQARLPSVKSVSTFGDVALWQPPKRDDGSRTTPRSWASLEDVTGSCVVAPLATRRSRYEVPRPCSDRYR